jgi:FtsZ-binding cell division protein ZapB
MQFSQQEIETLKSKNEELNFENSELLNKIRVLEAVNEKNSSLT